MSRGPLRGTKIVEIAGLGAGPMAATMLADMGAEIIRIDRLEPTLLDARDRRYDVTGRTRRSIAIDLRKQQGLALALSLIDRADGLIEAMRPGVTERLGLGPEVCLARNMRLVYGRATGWGQEGPLAPRAGHDLNYVAVTGVLAALGRSGAPPPPPLNLLADGSGAMLMAFGMVCGLLEATRSGRGQVVDAAMVDGVALLFAPIMAMAADGFWKSGRETNLVDGGSPFYEVYETADGHFISVAAIEPKFYARLLELIGLDPNEIPEQMDRAAWPTMKRRFAQIFRSKTRDEWCTLLGSEDVCFAPVLSAREAVAHQHAAARCAYVEVAGVTQPAPSPRFSRSGASDPTEPPTRGRDTDAVLRELGLAASDISTLRQKEVIA
jgi:alpha-methylacyl-CoA racemase